MFFFFFSKKLQKNFIFSKKLPLAHWQFFCLKNDNFWQFKKKKSQIFGRGGSDEHLVFRAEMSELGTNLKFQCVDNMTTESLVFYERQI